MLHNSKIDTHTSIGLTTRSRSEKLPSDIRSQHARILEWLHEKGPLSTIQARHELEIMHPAARIQELRLEHDIITHRQNIDTGRGSHQGVAEYVLLASV